MTLVFFYCFNINPLDIIISRVRGLGGAGPIVNRATRHKIIHGASFSLALFSFFLATRMISLPSPIRHPQSYGRSATCRSRTFAWSRRLDVIILRVARVGASRRPALASRGVQLPATCSTGCWPPAAGAAPSWSTRRPSSVRACTRAPAPPVLEWKGVWWQAKEMDRDEGRRRWAARLLLLPLRDPACGCAAGGRREGEAEAPRGASCSCDACRRARHRHTTGRPRVRGAQQSSTSVCAPNANCKL